MLETLLLHDRGLFLSDVERLITDRKLSELISD